MNIDRRQDTRHPCSLERCEGEFVFEVNEEEYEVVGVCDVSLSGIGIETSSYVEPDEPVALAYDEDGLSASVTGVISWCDEYPNSRGYYNLGVLFDYSEQDESSALYAALSDTIFDEV